MSKDIFSNNPTLDLYYKTSDGNAFFTKNAAHNHAKTLEDKSVKKVTKTSVKDDETKEIKTAEITVDSLLPAGDILSKEKSKANPDEAKAKVQEVLQKGAEGVVVVTEQFLTDGLVKNEGAGDAANSEAGNIEDTAAEYNQAVSDYTEKFGEAPFEGAELKKIKWAVQFNKKLTKPE